SDLASLAVAEPITISDLSLRRNDTGPNNIMIPYPSPRIELSATVTPNGYAGTTGTAQTTNLLTGLPEYPPTTQQPLGGITIPFSPVTANPNDFNLQINLNPDLTGPWTVTFSNDTATPPTVTATTNSIENVAKAPAPTNVALSGLASLNPTITWTNPHGLTGMQINIYDRDVILTNSVGGKYVDTVFTKDVPVTPSIFTVPTMLDYPYTVTPGTNYVISLKARVLLDPTGPNLDSNTKANYQTYYAFTPR